MPHRGERSERASAGARCVCGVAHAVERRRDGETAWRRRDGETGAPRGAGGLGGGARAVRARGHRGMGCMREAVCGVVGVCALPSSPPPPHPLPPCPRSPSHSLRESTLTPWTVDIVVARHARSTRRGASGDCQKPPENVKIAFRWGWHKLAMP